MDPRAIKRILVPTDFSEPSAEAVATGIAFARAFGATLDLVHVTVEATYAMPPPVDVATVPIDMSRVLERATKALEEAVARVRDAGVPVESATLVGARPDAEIVEHANQTGADLIVMGTHGRSGLAHAILGSVAERVIQHAHRPVLIVPAHGPAPA